MDAVQMIDVIKSVDASYRMRHRPYFFSYGELDGKPHFLVASDLSQISILNSSFSLVKEIDTNVFGIEKIEAVALHPNRDVFAVSGSGYFIVLNFSGQLCFQKKEACTALQYSPSGKILWTGEPIFESKKSTIAIRMYATNDLNQSPLEVLCEDQIGECMLHFSLLPEENSIFVGQFGGQDGSEVIHIACDGAQLIETKLPEMSNAGDAEFSSNKAEFISYVQDECIRRFSYPQMSVLGEFVPEDAAYLPNEIFESIGYDALFYLDDKTAVINLNELYWTLDTYKMEITGQFIVEGHAPIHKKNANYPCSPPLPEDWETVETDLCFMVRLGCHIVGVYDTEEDGKKSSYLILLQGACAQAF